MLGSLQCFKHSCHIVSRMFDPQKKRVKGTRLETKCRDTFYVHAKYIHILFNLTWPDYLVGAVVMMLKT